MLLYPKWCNKYKMHYFGGLRYAGKTFTMSGTEEAPGVYARSIGFIFQCLDDTQDDAVVEIAMMEIYCDQVRDLLGADSQQRLEVSGLGAGHLASFQERVPCLSWERIAGQDDALVRQYAMALCPCDLGLLDANSEMLVP
jgi:hypothetical protein